jgi:hypothetical protein
MKYIVMTLALLWGQNIYASVNAPGTLPGTSTETSSSVVTDLPAQIQQDDKHFNQVLETESPRVPASVDKKHMDDYHTAPKPRPLRPHKL